MVGVTLFGNMIGVIGENNIIWLLCALLLFYALLQMAVPSIPPVDTPESAVENSVNLIGLLKNRTTLRLLLAVSLIHGSHAIYYSYSVLYWTSLGMSVQTTGLLWGLSVASEILLFFFAGRLFKHWKVSSLFYLSAAAATLRWLGFGVGNEL